MFSNKIVWMTLFAILSMSSHAQENANSGTKILMERAHYWDKLGRSDMAARAWQDLLLIEPANAEALAGLARHQASPENKNGQANSSDQDRAHSGAGNAVRDMTAVSEHVQSGGEAKKVEDWADLYQGGVKEAVSADEPDADTGRAAALSANDQPSNPEAPDATQILQTDSAVKAEKQKIPAEAKNAAIAVSESNNTSPAKPTSRAPTATAAPSGTGQTEKWTDFYMRGFKAASPQDESNATPEPTGSLLVNEKPSKQELLDRAQYWESRGRADLAAKVRSHTSPPEPKQADAVADNKPVTASIKSASTDKPNADSPATGKPEPVRAAALRSATTDRKTVSNPLKTDSHAQTEAVPAENIPAIAAVKSGRQESLDRAQYWESRGRSDLAAQVHNQSNPAEPKRGEAASGKGSVGNQRMALAERLLSKNTPASDTPEQTGPGASENSPSLAGATPTRQELDERAKYWEARGRADLADKARNQSGPMDLRQGAGTGREANARVALAERQIARNILASDSRSQREPGTPENGPTLGGATPSRQELDEQAQYWEARGRSDLAEQLRKKLQSLEPATGISRRAGRETTQGQPLPAVKARDNEGASRSALEDSLLRNPNSLSIRLDLAKIYLSAGEMTKARTQIDSVLAASPDMPEALYASAQLYAAQRLWWETLHALEKISSVSRTTEMGKLQKTAWAHVQIDRADALVRQGNNAEAEILLRQVAAELAVNYNQARQAEPPSLWKSAAGNSKKAGR